MADHICQLKITLRGVEPTIWRRLLVPMSTNLAMLHTAIQETMGWEDCHLHAYRVRGERYEGPDPDATGPDTRHVRLDELGLVDGERFQYVYDFGDDWEHDLIVERILPREATKTYPICTGGARACPPEDSGGAVGYVYLLEAHADPENPDNAEVIGWLDPTFDAEAFDLASTNEALRVARGWGAV